MNNTIDEIIEKLNASKKVAVFCHARPDGDALGSALALTVALENMGKTAYACCEDAPPEKFRYIDAIKRVKNQIPNTDFDTFISVDCADANRIGVFTKRYKNFKKTTINIDHHISNEGYGKYNYVVNCPATCEIMSEIFIKAGYEVTAEIANLLMLGLVTDSGNFTHQDVSENTFKIAAFLRKCGADVNKINYNMFERQPKERARLYGRVMNDIRFALNDKFAYIVIRERDLVELNADRTLTEGFVDFPLTCDGVEVSASIMEYREGQYKTSLRSKGRVNVNAVAATFGGGGHILASGCMLFGDLDSVIERLTAAVKANL